MSDKQLWGAYVELEKERDMLRKEVASLRSGLQHEVDCVEACKEEIERLRADLDKAEDKIDRLERENKGIADWRTPKTEGAMK